MYARGHVQSTTQCPSDRSDRRDGLHRQRGYQSLRGPPAWWRHEPQRSISTDPRGLSGSACRSDRRYESDIPSVAEHVVRGQRRTALHESFCSRRLRANTAVFQPRAFWPRPGARSATSAVKAIATRWRWRRSCVQGANERVPSGRCVARGRTWSCTPRGVCSKNKSANVTSIRHRPRVVRAGTSQPGEGASKRRDALHPPRNSSIRRANLTSTTDSSVVGMMNRFVASESGQGSARSVTQAQRRRNSRTHRPRAQPATIEHRWSNDSASGVP